MKTSAERVQKHRARKLAAIPEGVLAQYFDSLPPHRSPSEAGAITFAADAAGEPVTGRNARRCPHCGEPFVREPTR